MIVILSLPRFRLLGLKAPQTFPRSTLTVSLRVEAGLWCAVALVVKSTRFIIKIQTPSSPQNRSRRDSRPTVSVLSRYNYDLKGVHDGLQEEVISFVRRATVACRRLRPECTRRIRSGLGHRHLLLRQQRRGWHLGERWLQVGLGKQVTQRLRRRELQLRRYLGRYHLSTSRWLWWYASELGNDVLHAMGHGWLLRLGVHFTLRLLSELSTHQET